MANFNPLHDKARQLLQAELTRMDPHDLLLPNSVGWRADQRPAAWMLRDLVDLMAENHHRPAAELEPMIRRMICENQFNDDNGDCSSEQHSAAVDVEVGMAIRTLERLRQHAIEQGLWSSKPNSPIMFG
jgi:hypothetical protein